MVATLYDESLDAFAPHGWPQRLRHLPPGLLLRAKRQFGNAAQGLPTRSRQLEPASRYRAVITYRSFPPTWPQNFWGYELPRYRTAWADGAACG